MHVLRKFIHIQPSLTSAWSISNVYHFIFCARFPPLNPHSPVLEVSLLCIFIFCARFSPPRARGILVFIFSSSTIYFCDIVNPVLPTLKVDLMCVICQFKVNSLLAVHKVSLETCIILINNWLFLSSNLLC